MRLKEKYISEIRSNQSLKVKLQAAFGYISESTLYQKLKRNDSSLTEYNILTILSKEFDEKIEDLLESK